MNPSGARASDSSGFHSAQAGSNSYAAETISNDQASKGTNESRNRSMTGQYGDSSETGSIRFDPFSDQLSFAQRNLSGRARAGTLPSSFTRVTTNSDGDNGSGDTPAGSVLRGNPLIGSQDQLTAWTSVLSSDSEHAPTTQSDYLSAIDARMTMPRFKGSYTGSVPGTPSGLEGSADFVSVAGLNAFGSSLGSNHRPLTTHRSSLTALRQASQSSFHEGGRASPALGTRSRTPSNLSNQVQYGLSSLHDPENGKGEEPLRSRSGSNASLRGTSVLSAGPIGTPLFKSGWSERIGAGDHDSSTSRRSSTMASSSRPASKASFTFDHSPGQARETTNSTELDGDQLDSAQAIHTLDYLGLENDDSAPSSNERPFFGANAQMSRNRASTLAAMPQGGALSRHLGDTLFGRGSTVDHGGKTPHVMWPLSLAQNDIPGMESKPQSFGETSTGQTSSILGRNRAGTVAALGGPGGRQRLQQELLRMASVGNQSGLSNEEVTSLLRAHLESLGLGSHGGLLEGFPHLDLSTPPPLSNRQSPHPTQPATPTFMGRNRSHSKSSYEDPTHQLASIHIGRSQAPGGLTGSSRDALQRPTSSINAHQTPSRSLWIGNLSSSTTGQELMHVFAAYGAIESLRLLPEKECGFVNFVDIADAVRAREDVLERLGGRLESLGTGPGGRVRVGFGKIDSNTSSHSHTPAASLESRSTNAAFGTASLPVSSASASADDNAAQGEDEDSGPPTRALWVGSIPNTATHNTLLSVFQPFGPIESARVLSHKNCGFINFERVDDAVRARKMLNGRDVLGSEVGAMRIGFAKVPSRNTESIGTTGPDAASAIKSLAQLKGSSHLSTSAEEQASSGNMENYRSNLVISLLNDQQRKHQAQASQTRDQLTGRGARSSQQATFASTSATPSRPTGASASSSIVPASDKGGVPLPPDMTPRPSTTDLQLLMAVLSENEPDAEQDVASVANLRPSATYYMTLPLVTEVSSGRRFETSRLRETRRSIESGQLSVMDCDRLALDFLDSIVDLASDYIGNTLVQKFFEACSEKLRVEMLHRLAPHLAVVGCHKNGTWAAQKIIDCADTDEQMLLIVQHLRAYIPGLLLNEYGNYVVQCCLPWKQHNDFVFDAMVDRCWEIAQGRFGARSMRACLESMHTTNLQRKRVAIAIILNSVPLATSSNGALLLAWLLEGSSLTRSFKLLAPRLAPHLAHLCTHKVASPTVLRLVTQDAEPAAAQTILQALFEPYAGRTFDEQDNTPTNDRPSQVLEEIVTDQVHGSQFIAKVLASSTLTTEQREQYAVQVKILLEKHNLIGVPAYRRLCEDLGISTGGFHSAFVAGHPTRFAHRSLQQPANYAATPMQQPPNSLSTNGMAPYGAEYASMRHYDPISAPATANPAQYSLVGAGASRPSPYALSGFEGGLHGQFRPNLASTQGMAYGAAHDMNQRSSASSHAQPANPRR